MVPIPDGRVEWNGKPHEVKGLCFGETEVTWDVFDVWAFRLDQSPEEIAQGVDAESRPSRPYGAPDQGFGHSGFAAITMTANGARVFCEWLSAKTGKRYRLPTEAEWDYAARAGSWNPESLDASAWFWDNADDRAQPVGKKRSNVWGLFDMVGNVAEWSIAADGFPITCGGSYLSKRPDAHPGARQKQQPKWNERDPQNPKSLWWLPDAPFVGFRLVCEG